MSDDITRQRFWSENNAKPDPKPRGTRSSGRRSRKGVLTAAVANTHALLVRRHGERNWLFVDKKSGSEAFCEAELELSVRHWPDNEWRVLPIAEAEREVRRKTWSIHDADHIAVGERVMLDAAPVVLIPEIARVNEAFGMDRSCERERMGTVTRRDRRSGAYSVRLDGKRGPMTITVEREHLIYPVPEGVIPIERKSKAGVR